jgi:hypothetical protein
MKFLAHLFLTLFLALPLAAASSLPHSNTQRASASRTFTVQAYQSPYPTGQFLTGYYLFAKGGSLYLAPNRPSDVPVLSVNSDSRASIVSLFYLRFILAALHLSVQSFFLFQSQAYKTRHLLLGIDIGSKQSKSKTRLLTHSINNSPQTTDTKPLSSTSTPRTAT